MSSFFANAADAIESDWRSHARPEQLPPDDVAWAIWLILAGRGWGKTRTGAEWVRGLAESGAVERIALVGPTASDARDVMVEGASGILSISRDSFRPLYEPSKRRISWPNGVTATMFSSEEPERLRGPQFGAAWLDELGAWRNVRETWDQLQFGLRLGSRPRQVITTTPRPLKLLKEIMKRGDVAITRGSTFDNRENLAPSFFSEIVKRYEGTRTGRQELNAELLEDIEGALWTRDLLEKSRCDPASVPNMRRIVVAIDPAVSVSETSDETGLVVCGIGTDGRGYVLEDGSGKFGPIEWARRAVNLYRKWSADRVIAEVNNGGAMVETTLRMVDPSVSYKPIHASRGKLTRAEPISALFEQGRVSLVGGFPELEDQLTSYAPGTTDSPDRMDAMVWAFSELMVERQGRPTRFMHLDFMGR